jgi:translation initiation factor IF-2
MAKKANSSAPTPTFGSAVPRPPVVVVMGHVDHGKSSLLDYIRNSNIVMGEAGGITQHIGAYEVVHPYENTERHITFIDTPGHAAFSAIRSRGARVADIAILVVSAEDGVKAQTLEARDAIESANVPYVVAINKIDKPNADLNKTHSSLIEHGIYVEGFGGTTPWVGVSAKTGAGVTELLDTILLLSDVQTHTGVIEAPAEGTVIEAHQDKKRGMTATIIIKNGTLHRGEYVVAGHAIAPVRIMEDAKGVNLESATFSTPVQLVGFDTLPDVGSTISVFSNKKDAEANRVRQMPTDLSAWTNESDSRLLIPLIVKCDAIGSLEAIEGAVEKYTNDRVIVKIVRSGIGPITEADMKVAQTSPHSLIIGFNVVADQTASEVSLRLNIPLYYFDIIYRLTEWLTETVTKMTPKKQEKITLGVAKILKSFSATKHVKTIGCSVSEGEIAVGATVSLTRRGEYLGKGTVSTIQVARQSATVITAGNECGMQIETEVDLKEGDTIASEQFIEV